MHNTSRWFDYDAQPALDIADEIIGEGKNVVVHDISYVGADSRVGAYLVTPKGPGPFSGVLFGHWGHGTRAQFISEAKLYARGGAICLIPDYPWDRKEPLRRTLNHFDGPQLDRETYIQTVIEFRRGLDLLLMLSHVDPARIAYVGHSYGAQWGAILAAVDKRFKTLVLMAGVPGIADYLMDSAHPDAVELRKTLPAGDLGKYVDVMGTLDAIHFIGRRPPVPLLLQFARYEQYFDEASAQRFIHEAGDQNAVIWYEADHGLSDPQSLVDRHRWLTDHLALRDEVRPHHVDGTSVP